MIVYIYSAHKIMCNNIILKSHLNISFIILLPLFQTRSSLKETGK